MYSGYFEEIYFKYASCFKEYLEYSSENQKCSCFWPETSTQALEINNIAFKLFSKLFSHAEIHELIINQENQFNLFVKDSSIKLSKYGSIMTCIVHSFFYSDYDWICRDIEHYAQNHFDQKVVEKIHIETERIRETLAPLFFKLYRTCLSKHSSEKIQQELLLLNLQSMHSNSDFDESKLLLISSGDIYNNDIEDIHKNLAALSNSENETIESVLVKKLAHPLFTNAKIEEIPNRPSNWCLSDIYFEQGRLLNEFILYPHAIELLTQAIQHNPSNRAAYIERASAYFETNQLRLAQNDYEIAKKLTIVPPFEFGNHGAVISMGIYTPENKIAFSRGLVSGIIEGGRTASIEFVPSILSCSRGLFNGLWAFVCAPIEVGDEITKASFAIGEFIYKHRCEECIQFLVPEIKELSESWDNITDFTRGEKLGYIIGKYGVDIFAPLGAIKGLNKIRALKQANTMQTLECCAMSSKQIKILEESRKFAAIRATILESSNAGKILVKSSNVQYHVMQPKHAWNKILKLSGNIEEDFKKLTHILENESIFSKECFLRSKEFSQGKIIRSDYQKSINGHQVQAIFETYTETNQSFLKDAWVITK